MISCGGGVGRIRSGGLSSGPSLMSFRATEEHFLSKAASPKPGEAGRSALVRRPKLRPEKEAMRARRWCVCVWGRVVSGGQHSRKPGQQVTLPAIVFPCDISPLFLW